MADVIELPLRDIYGAPPCRADQLTVVQDELTPEEVERLTDTGGWEDYREEDYRRTLLPDLGPERHFAEGGTGGVRFYTGDSFGAWGRDWPASDPPVGVVIPVNGRTYRVSMRVRDIGDGTMYEAKGKVLVFEPTDAPPTQPLPAPPPVGTRRRVADLKFFGQPCWVQNSWCPQDLRGEPCRHLVTVENEWGDMGNWNILIGFDEAGVPNVAYFEASCC